MTTLTKFADNLPHVVNFNYLLPNNPKNWQILQIKNKLEDFRESLIIPSPCNRNIRDIIGRIAIVNNQVLRKSEKLSQHGSYKPCLTQRENLCYKQIIVTKTFKKTVKKFSKIIFHIITSKYYCWNYLLKWILYKIQYFGICKIWIKIRLNNYKKGVNYTNWILALKHFSCTCITFSIT